VELSQTKGLTLTVINSTGDITQTATFDGTTITHTCKGPISTSTLTQTSSDISIKCTNFKIDADTISCVSTKNTTHTAYGSFSVDSTQKATISSLSDLDISATNALSMSGMDLCATGHNTAKISAITTTINGDQKTNVKGASLELSAQVDAKLTGATVKAVADTTMNIEGLTTTVKGSMTNIQGNLIKLG
jgi:hypothetical protein